MISAITSATSVGRFCGGDWNGRWQRMNGESSEETACSVELRDKIDK